MNFVLDIEANMLLQDALDYSSLPYKLKPDFKVWCIVVRHVESGKVKSIVGKDLTKDNLQNTLKKCTNLIGHNLVQYDLPVLKLYGLIDYNINYPGANSVATLFDNPCRITDTLLLSKLLNADRFGGHSLDAWGKRLGNYKEDFKDFSKLSQEMLEYCIQDTAVNVDIYRHLLTEMGEHDWSLPYSMEIKLYDIGLKRELFGFHFDKELAEKNVKELDAFMQEIAAKVDPLLPEKKMTKGAMSDYTMPKIRFKKNGDMSAVMEKFLTKINATYNSETRSVRFEDKLFPVDYQDALKTTTKATIEDIDTVKSHLLTLGWVPTEIKERDLTKNQDKTVKKVPEVIEAIERYLKQTEDSVFKQLRLDFFEVSNMEELRALLFEKLSDTKPQTKWGKAQPQRPIFVPTTPKLSVGVEKELCPNLVALGEKADFVRDVVKYYTYRHRKNAIAGGVLDEDGEPETGFLSCVREDGRIPTPADTLGANTGRYRHKIVCNVPRVTSLYGEPMRNLFGCGEGFYQLGFDFASLEARIMGHYVIPFTDGQNLANALVAEKPNDIHCYREDTEILTLRGWKKFGELTEIDKVAQYSNGSIEFVKPVEIVWQRYEGLLLNDPVSGYSVTPNHRVYYTSYSAKQKGKQSERIVQASKFKPSSDKRLSLGGIVNAEDYSFLSDIELQLIIATQADGYLNLDNSGIQFTFVKQRKIDRMLNLLQKAGVKYGKSIHTRKGREEVKLRIPAGELATKIRQFLTSEKELSFVLLQLSARQIRVLLDEIQHWDGTLKGNSDVVLDTTSKQTVDILQTLSALVDRKCKTSSYIKHTTFGDCRIYRAYISKEDTPNVLAANKELQSEVYSGFIGCVSVPSGLVLVRRNGIIIVSGNTLNARKLGIDRSSAKSFSYAAIYGAQPKKLAKMLGVDMQEAQRLFNEYWDAVPALKELKSEVEQEWEDGGKKHIKGLDGRLLNTRSKHSLINVLFQSGGAISAKWTTVLLCKTLEEQNLLGNPFEDTKNAVKVWMMIEMHDEAQMAVHPSLLKIKGGFADEKAAKEASKEFDGTSAVGHGTKGYYFGEKTVSVEAIEKAIQGVCQQFEMNVDLGFEWIPGKTWGQCH